MRRIALPSLVAAYAGRSWMGGASCDAFVHPVGPAGCTPVHRRLSSTVESTAERTEPKPKGYASYTSAEIASAQAVAEEKARCTFDAFACNALFVNVDERPDPVPCAVSPDSPNPSLPADFPAGCLLRIGPNGASTDEGFLDGDGLVHCITLPPSGASEEITYSSTYVDTNGRKRERASGNGAKYAGTLGAAPRGLPMLGNLLRNGLKFRTLEVQKDTCNTALAVSGSRVLALMEQSPPSEIEVTVDGRVRTVESFARLGGAIQPAPISGGCLGAHGRTDPATGERVHVSYQSNSRPFVRVDTFKDNWELKSSVGVDVPVPVMVHDCALTENHVVILDFPLTIRPRRFLADSFPVEYEPQNGARIGLTPRRGAMGRDETQWFDVESGVVLHAANAYERDDGTVVVHGFKSVPSGDASYILDYTPAFLYEWVLDPSTGTTVSERCLNPNVMLEFPQVPDDAIGREASLAYGLVCTSIGGPLRQFRTPDSAILLDSVTALALEEDMALGRSPGDVVSRFDLPEGWHAVSEPTVVAKTGGDGHYVLLVATFVPKADDNAADHVMVATDGKSMRTQFLVLDGDDISRGPVTSINLPHHVNYGLHSQFVPWEVLKP